MSNSNTHLRRVEFGWLIFYRCMEHRRLTHHPAGGRCRSKCMQPSSSRWRRNAAPTCTRRLRHVSRLLLDDLTNSSWPAASSTLLARMMRMICPNRRDRVKHRIKHIGTCLAVTGSVKRAACGQREGVQAARRPPSLEGGFAGKPGASRTGLTSRGV